MLFVFTAAFSTTTTTTTTTTLEGKTLEVKREGDVTENPFQ
jgi:hypothetical protein